MFDPLGRIVQVLCVLDLNNLYKMQRGDVAHMRVGMYDAHVGSKRTPHPLGIFSHLRSFATRYVDPVPGLDHKRNQRRRPISGDLGGQIKSE